MALRKILYFPNPQLRLKAELVLTVNDEIRLLVDDMLETMYENRGIGLAATQIDVQQAAIIIDIDSNQRKPLVLIDPEIIEKSGHQVGEEGCLSVPGIYEKVKRADKIRVKALNRDGKLFEIEVDGLLSVCIQHEMDHLEGKLFIDHLSPLKRQLIKKKMKKIQRNTL